MRIAIDAMGGDYAPGEIVAGAAEAAKAHPESRILLVGMQQQIEREINALKAFSKNLEIIHASESIAMDDEPVAALRQKPDSSIAVGIRLVREGQADGLISAGNTGALVGGSHFGLGMLEGIKRPGIAVPLPTLKGFCAMIDAGANPNCKPLHLLQYAIMGSLYYRVLSETTAEPKIGLLNIGQESQKGNAVVREAHEQFTKSIPGFAGNIEPHRIFRGDVDVVVCDGFAGNLVLKTGEGIGVFIFKKLAVSLAEHLEVMPQVAQVFEQLDFSEYGGAPLLGIKGIVVKCHGRSRAKAITNAVRLASRFISQRFNERLVEEMNRHSSTHGWSEAEPAS